MDFVVLCGRMKLNGQKTAFILFVGDIFFLLLALWLTLLVRYAAWPTQELLLQHLAPFSLIFVSWVIVFIISDLYRKPTALFRRQLPQLILRAQVINTIIAIAFFYFVPIFGITPRTNLFIYLIISFILIVSWRTFVRYYKGSGRRLNIIFICGGAEAEEIKHELRSNDRYGLAVRERSELTALPHDNSLIIVFNPYQAGAETVPMPQLLMQGVAFINVHDLYEDIFERIPISILDDQWFLENISSRSNIAYDVFKRFFDLVVALGLGIISLIFYPFIAVAIKLEDGGPIFYSQERVGRGNQTFLITKFRSMSMESDLHDRHVTKVGRFLRKTRLDELPQLWSVITGRQSLVGPRPEQPDYVSTYKSDIPYYDLRHMITPGLSGWAQIYHDNHPHFAADGGATKEKLSYDLFYIKNRGIILDLIIGLKTLRILLGSKGI